MMMYIHERSDWPKFRWSERRLAELLAVIRHKQGRLIGRMESLGFHLQEEAVLCTLTEDVLKTSEIEGQILDQEQVRSSLARRLGMDIGGLKRSDRHVEGMVEMLLDATQNFNQPLTKIRLFGWHAAMFPSKWSGMTKITVGAWRNDKFGPVQVISGPIGRERVHFQGPDAKLLHREMSAFLKWFNNEKSVDPVLKAGVAHLWFVTIHPFDDGNGRIARAIADMLLAYSEQTSQRFYSMSAQIRSERNAYYDILERTQKGNMEIILWLEWFLNCLGRAIDEAQITLAFVLRKAEFWKSVALIPITDRQRLVLNHLLDGFESKLTSSKWAKLTKCSQDTALRDIIDLVDRGILTKDKSGGRSTSYSLTEAQ
jgi:Fic family protein